MENAQNFSWEKFHSFPVVGILRGFDIETVLALTEVAHVAGLTTIEVTMNTDGATEQIRALCDATQGRMNIGAGTVTSPEELGAALGAGASFVVTPVFSPDVVATCKSRGIPVFPGALTPTEVWAAAAAGADIVKLFPASQMGPGYLKTLLAPLSNLRLMAVGGVSLDTAGAFMAAGAVGLGVGSPLFNRQRMAARDWEWLAEQVSAFRAAVAPYVARHH